MLRQETTKAFEVLAVGNKNAITALDEIESYLKSFLPSRRSTDKQVATECKCEETPIKPAKGENK